MTVDRQKPKIVVVCGPTGIGKTSTALAIAGRLAAEIVNADSMQIYCRMDVGTAKPTPEERARTVHHLIDILDPDAPFDAAQYAQLAMETILERRKAGILPLVVGGTGLYIKALIHGLFPEKTSDAAVRKALKAEAGSFGSPHLHGCLERIDPETAQKIHPNDAYRIIRALEIYRVTGTVASRHHRDHRFSEDRFRTLMIGLHMDRQTLYDRIDRRVDRMMAAGLLEEVHALLEMNYDETLKSMQSIGYRHMVDYLRGRISLPEAVRILKRDTRRYAKRQMTWFRADPDVVWFEPKQVDAILDRIHRFLQNTERN